MTLGNVKDGWERGGLAKSWSGKHVVAVLGHCVQNNEIESKAESSQGYAGQHNADDIEL